MAAIKNIFGGLLLGLTVLWAWTDAPAMASAGNWLAWRGLLVQYTGVLGLAVMSVAMVLAIRPAWLEDRLDGLDKMYRLHKWLGIAGLVLSIAHWLASQAPKWLIQAGWLERPARGPRQVPQEAIFQFFQSQRGLAEGVGEWAFYAAVALIAIALIKWFPYRHFFKTHRWLAAIYLALVFHGIVLLNYSDWTTPLGLLLTLLVVAGSVGAVISLTRRIGVQRKAMGVIESISHLQGVQVNAITLQLKHRWAGHEAGQFAFVTFHAHEGAHPFTISSAWLGDGKLSFLIKGLGDYTSTLANSLKVGDEVMVEGPYGRFNFEGTPQRQIWIGGGIGITPFVARLKELANRPDGREVDLFYCTSQPDETALQLLQADAQAAGIRLHVLVSTRDGRLSGERLRAAVPDWAQADVWFCGPAAFGQAIRSDLAAHGLDARHFHQELFAMR